MTSEQEQALRALKEKINQARANRPTRDQALNAICMAHQYLKYATDIINDIFNRENDFRLYNDLAKQKQHDLDKIKL